MKSSFEKITLAAFLISGLGLLFELLAFPDFSPAFREIVYSYLGYLGYYVHLNFLMVSSLQYYNSVSGMSANYLNIAFYLLMLAGAFFYVKSHQKETRLIRFSFAIIGGANVIGFFTTALSLLLYWNEYQQQSPSFVGIGLFALRRVAIAVICLWVLKELHKTKTLSFSTNAAGEDILQSTPRAQRFLHHVLDTFFCVMLFSGFNYMLYEKFLSEWVRDVGEEPILAMLLVLYRVLYYLLFEGSLSSTPAKYLTESRIVTFEGKRIDFPIAILRTFTRFVPFEPLSFFGRSGWHDLWSKTDVVKEEKTGVSGGRYFLIIPVVIVFGLATYFGEDWYRDYRNYLRARESHEAKMSDFESELNHLTTSHFIRFEAVSDYYGSDKFYLKVDSVYNGKADVSYFVYSESGDSPVAAAEYFRSHSHSADKQTIEISSLIRALPRDYDDYDDREDEGYVFLDDKKNYRIKEVFVEGAPFLSGSGSGSLYNLSISLSIDNCGWPGTVTAIRNVEGNVTWSNEVPFEVGGRSPEHWGCSSFSLEGTSSARGEHYKVEFDVTDSQGRVAIYVLEGAELSRTLRKKF